MIHSNQCGTCSREVVSITLLWFFGRRFDGDRVMEATTNAAILLIDDMTQQPSRYWASNCSSSGWMRCFSDCRAFSTLLTNLPPSLPRCVALWHEVLVDLHSDSLPQGILSPPPFSRRSCLDLPQDGSRSNYHGRCVPCGAYDTWSRPLIPP